ncbi:MAG: ATP-binding protein [Moorea sp. SIO2B7]|nr:ATP-binding protein [Moorena sp. SIO2B7]
MSKQRQKLPKQFRLQVKTKLEALTEVLAWFEQISKPFLEDKCVWQCQLAIAEGFSNAVRYAHQGLPETTPINLEINLFSDFLEIKIWDSGKPFDLKAKLQSILNDKDNDPLEREGNRGLYFMDQLTDELQYIRMSNKRNCLLMRKYINGNQEIDE